MQEENHHHSPFLLFLHISEAKYHIDMHDRSTRKYDSESKCQTGAIVAYLSHRKTLVAAYHFENEWRRSISTTQRQH